MPSTSLVWKNCYRSDLKASFLSRDEALLAAEKARTVLKSKSADVKKQCGEWYPTVKVDISDTSEQSVEIDAYVLCNPHTLEPERYEITNADPFDSTLEESQQYDLEGHLLGRMPMLR